MKFIVFGEDWGQHPSSTQHLFKIIGQQYKVYWFNSIGLRAPSFALKDIKRVWQKFTLMLSAATRRSKTATPKHLSVFNPKVLPWHLNTWVNRYNQKQIEAQLNTLNDEPVVYWISLPTAIRAISPRSQDKVIYYCGDDFTGLAGVDHKMAYQTEQELIQRADQIFVASPYLLKKMPPKKTLLLEHGVDCG